MMRANQQRGNSGEDDTLKLLRAANIPDSLLQALAPFQQEGVRFVMNNDGRALVADEMGLGECVYAYVWMTISLMIHYILFQFFSFSTPTIGNIDSLVSSYFSIIFINDPHLIDSLVSSYFSIIFINDPHLKSMHSHVY